MGLSLCSVSSQKPGKDDYDYHDNLDGDDDFDYHDNLDDIDDNFHDGDAKELDFSPDKPSEERDNPDGFDEYED